MPLQIIRNDITKVKADAIVNTANPDPVVGGGTDQAIYTAAGEEKLLAARRKIGVINPGEAYATPAFGLDANLIIHTVGPVWEGGEQGEKDVLRSCYKNSIELAKEYKCRSVAFPLISTGTYEFPKSIALDIARETIEAFLKDNEMDVFLVVFDEESFSVSSEKFKKIKAFVDAEYAKAAMETEYEGDFNARDVHRTHRDVSTLQRFHRPGARSNSPVLAKDLAKKPQTFRSRYLELIKERLLDPADVYTGYYDRRIFSKLQKNENYHPSKYMAIIMCLSLQLDLAGTLELMSYASLAMNPTYAPDIIIMNCIIKGEFRIRDINAALNEQGLPDIEVVYQ